MMGYSKKELDELWNASVDRREMLVAEYKKTHKVPSRGTIMTPEIQAELDVQKRLYDEFLKLEQVD